MKSKRRRKPKKRAHHLILIVLKRKAPKGVANRVMTGAERARHIAEYERQEKYMQEIARRGGSR